MTTSLSFPDNVPFAIRMRGSGVPIGWREGWVCLWPNDTTRVSIPGSFRVNVVTPSGFSETIDLRPGGDNYTLSNLYDAIAQRLSVAPTSERYWLNERGRRVSSPSEPIHSSRIQISVVSPNSPRLEQKILRKANRAVPLAVFVVSGGGDDASVVISVGSRHWAVANVSSLASTKTAAGSAELAVIAPRGTTSPAIVLSQFPDVTSFYCSVANNLSEATHAFGRSIWKTSFSSDGGVRGGCETARLLAAAHYQILFGEMKSADEELLARELSSRFASGSGPVDCGLAALLLLWHREDLHGRFSEAIQQLSVSDDVLRPTLSATILSASKIRAFYPTSSKRSSIVSRFLGDWLQRVDHFSAQIDAPTGLLQEQLNSFPAGLDQKKTLELTADEGSRWLYSINRPPPLASKSKSLRARQNARGKTRELKTRNRLRSVAAVDRLRLTVHRSNIDLRPFIPPLRGRVLG